MVDIKWVKFEVGMYDDIKLKILDQTQNRDLNHYVWARSVVLAGKINCGGYLYINDNIPYYQSLNLSRLCSIYLFVPLLMITCYH